MSGMRSFSENRKKRGFDVLRIIARGVLMQVDENNIHSVAFCTIYGTPFFDVFGRFILRGCAWAVFMRVS